MQTVTTLISIAREKVHTDRELAAALGIKPSELTEMKKERRPMSAETAASLCHVAGITGEEARRWVAIALIENPKNADRIGLLRRTLFSLGALGFAVLGSPQNEAQAALLDQNTVSAPVDKRFVVNGSDLYIVA